MKQAIKLAKKGEGKTLPNPMVGAVLVKNNKIIGTGYHKFYGGPHAELEAINKSCEKIEGASLYTSLEPCTHFGKTPPCVDTIIKAKIKKVYIAMLDPNPLVYGKSIQKLSQFGIEVETGLLENEAKKLNEIYIKYITTQKPFVILKAATSLDGKINTCTKDSKWISSDKSRKYVHLLRSKVSAILVGIETINTDNPQLTIRLNKIKIPWRIILDSRCRIKLDAQVLNHPSKTIIATTILASSKKIKILEQMGVKILVIKLKDNKIDLCNFMKKIGKLGITSIMVEGGSEVYTSFLQAKLIDKIFLFIAPKLIGGKNADTIFEGEGLKISDAITLKDLNIKKIVDDILIEGYPYYK